MNAKSLGFWLCSSCHKLIRAHVKSVVYCTRCGAAVSARTSNSLTRSWALLLSSIFLYIPANVLPIITINNFGQGETDTILSGILHLLGDEMYLIAVVVFVASILVPLLKMIGIAVLLCSVQLHWRLSFAQRMLMFRIIEYIGRWSMLDIFVVTILVTLVDFGHVASIQAGPATTAFSAVVVLTMLAAISFDSRLIWDQE